MNDFGWGALVAVVIGLFGLFIKGRGGKEDKAPESIDTVEAAKEILNDHVDEVRKAGSSYTDSMARTPIERMRDIIEWSRKRTGDG